MNTLLRLSVLCCAALAASCCCVNELRRLDMNEWLQFKGDYECQLSLLAAKVYASTETEMQAAATYVKNKELIDRHNAEFKRGFHSFELGMNEFGDMTTEEFNLKMKGYAGSNSREPMNVHKKQSSDRPDKVDWRNEGYVTGVKNQGVCGSCWAFSATGSLEGQMFKKTGKLVSLSEQNLVDCSKKEGNMGCRGGLMDQAFDYIKANGGLDTEESYPYKGRNGKCHYSDQTVGADVTSYVDIVSQDEDNLQDAISTIGPISCAMDASGILFRFYRRGLYKPLRCSSKNLDHGVLAVGYDKTSSGQAYYIVKNSWGSRWGQNGYFWLPRNSNNRCGIATNSSYPIV